jgi:NACHT domain
LGNTRTYLRFTEYVGGAGVSAQLNATLEQVLNVTSKLPSPVTISKREIDYSSAASSHGDAILAKLKPSNLECGPCVAECMDGTRQDIFARIDDWVADPAAPNILWIKGYPGIGKSAIASSLVERLRLSKRLGSSFFFQRERSTVMTPNALWRVIAYDLARQYSSIRRHLAAALEADETIINAVNIDKLFRQLIQEPLMVAKEIPVDRLPIIVIDALDECGGLDGSHSDDRKNLMRTLESWSRLLGGYRLVVTSRGEHDVERLFSTISHRLIEIHAGEVVATQSSDDVRSFFEGQFRQIAAQYASFLPADWPGSETILDLTKRAAGLFIWAKTVVKFVTRGGPDGQLRKILEGSGTDGMASLYSWILHTSFPDPNEDFLQTFYSLMGGIILAKAPLTTSSVMHLLSLEGPILEYICNGLQSVMDSEDILRINHQSFVDFLLDQNKCPPKFIIDRKRESRNLTLACLNTMGNNLRFNICDLDTSYLRNAEVPDIQSLVEERISPHLSYSCRFWAGHLVETAFEDEIFTLLQKFMLSQLLFWLEVLSLTKLVNLASSMLRILADWIRVRFAHSNAAIANKSLMYFNRPPAKTMQWR